MSASAAVERANADARDQRMRALRGELEQVAEELQETEKIHQEAQELGDESLLEEIQGDLARLQVRLPALWRVWPAIAWEAVAELCSLQTHKASVRRCWHHRRMLFPVTVKCPWVYENLRQTAVWCVRG